MDLNQLIPNPRSALSVCAMIVLLTSLAAVPDSAGAAKTKSPHWRKDSCEACHQAAQPTAGQAALKAMPAAAVCADCHGKKGASVCRHRSDIAPEPGSTADFDDALRAGLDDGMVVCTTCHDMTPHCALDVKQRYRNKSFLRGGPFERSSDQCFGCHSKSGYRQRSPHRQVSKGKIKEGTCVFCHGKMPQQDASGQWLPVEYATEGPVSQLCSGCHGIGPHPSSSMKGKSGWIHMVAPPMEYAERIRKSVAERGGSLPLDPNTGTITCTTCHNPHARKLEGYPRSGEKTKTKLRYEDICGVCHDS
jgi:predicted CXXCH cytochrome family protein